MTIELVGGREWWVKIAGTCVVRLGLSPKATPTEARMLAEQTLVEMVRAAVVSP